MDWQSCIAIGIVALAASVLIKQLVGFVCSTSVSGCGNCPSKGQARNIKSLPLVQLEKKPVVKKLENACKGNAGTRQPERIAKP